MTIRNLKERCIPMANFNPNFVNLASGIMTAIDYKMVEIYRGTLK